MAISSPFVWGSKGRKMSPEALERERAIIDGIKGRVGDTSPVDHWLQGAGRVVDAITGQIRDRRAEASEQMGMDSADDYIANNPVLSNLIGSGGSGVSYGVPLAATQPSIPAGADDIRAGLIERGLPEHVADGFIMNFQDESGLNPGINEQNPLVPGSRGGFGLAQWTGPRRRALEAFAQQRGTPVSDTNTQLDFLMQELQGPEAAAAQSIFGAGDAGSAAAAIVNQFLRPAEEHRARRVAEYTGGQGYTPQQQQQGSNVVAALAGAMSDPWVAKKYGPAIQALMGQQMKRGDMEYQARLQAEMQANDPYIQAQIDKIYGRNGATGGDGAGVRSSQILADGTLVQSTDAGPRVFGPTGDLLTGQEAADAIRAANAYDVENQREIYGGRRSGTLGADIDMGGKAASSVESGKIAAAAGNAAYEGYQKVMGNLSNIYEAVAAIDSGAKSGITQKYLPNISVASATLANTMNRMGLDVIGSVTFGALSEAEMNLAMDTAVPRDLSPPELREWLVAKGEAQQKAAEALYQAGLYLSKPGNTIDSWMAENPPEFIPFGQPQTDPNPQHQIAPAPNDQTSTEQGAMNFSQMSAGEMVQIDIDSLKPEQMDAFDARMKELGY